MKIKSKKWIERENLRIWREEVLKRDKGLCQICMKKPNMQHIHHIIPRKVKELRYDVMNGITLNFYYHKVGKNSAHQNALFFSSWLRKNKPKQYKYLMRFVNLSTRKMKEIKIKKNATNTNKNNHFSISRCN